MTRSLKLLGQIDVGTNNIISFAVSVKKMGSLETIKRIWKSGVSERVRIDESNGHDRSRISGKCERIAPNVEPREREREGENGPRSLSV